MDESYRRLVRVFDGSVQQFHAILCSGSRGCFCVRSGGRQHLCGHHVDLSVIRGLNASFDTKHFSHGILIAMLDLKLFPDLQIDTKKQLYYNVLR